MSSMDLVPLLIMGLSESITSCSLIGGRTYPCNLLPGVLIIVPALSPPTSPPGFAAFSGTISADAPPFTPTIENDMGGTLTLDGCPRLLAMVESY